MAYTPHALLLFCYLYFLFFIYLVSGVIFHFHKDKIFFCTIILLFNDLLDCYTLFIWFVIFVFLVLLVLNSVFWILFGEKDRNIAFSQY
ncbi:hypothetical protein EOI67_24225 [Salmonella enterica]|nr:hypothetical protein [Salmonella enterica]EAS9893720.1 hypothetical protein [Salmonella enterica]